MKKLKIEFRLFIAEWLLGKAMSMAPVESKEGLQLINLVGFYFCTKLNKK